MTTEYEWRELTYLVQCRPTEVVAFYDRSSSDGKQAKNYMRKVSCEIAKEIAAEYRFEYVESKCVNNDGICFLDIGTGKRSDNRPEFMRLLTDEQIDTIIAVSRDRLYRDPVVYEQLKQMVCDAGKNLAVITYDIEVEFMREIKRAFEQYLAASQVP